jgi:hypothetical protein
MSDFVKFLKENNLIKDLKEAFIKNPVSEEVHQGDINYYINEEITIYSHYQIGDIIYVKNYTNEQVTNHLFVIIDENNISVPIEYYGMLISSKINKASYKSNLLLKKDQDNKLNLNSIVKCDNIYRILENQIDFKLGIVNLKQVEIFKGVYKSNLKIY